MKSKGERARDREQGRGRVRKRESKGEAEKRRERQFKSNRDTLVHTSNIILCHLACSTPVSYLSISL